MKRQNRSASIGTHEESFPANDDEGSVVEPVEPIEPVEPDATTDHISDRTVPAWTVIRSGSGFARVRLALTPGDVERLTVTEHAPDIRGVVIGHLMLEIDREMK